MKKVLLILAAFAAVILLALGLRSCVKTEEVRITFPFDVSDVETVEMYHYIDTPADAEKKVVTAPEDILYLYDSFESTACQVKKADTVTGAEVTSFRFNLKDGNDYELIYAGYGVKNGEIMSPTGNFRYFTSADINWKWYYVNENLKSVPAEPGELPLCPDWHPTGEATELPTAVEVIED